MRGVHSDIDDTRRSVFREVARLAYEGGDYSRVDQIPYKLVPNGSTAMRYDVFLDRAVVAARVKLALGMELHTDAPGEPLSQRIWDAATDQKYFEEPLVNIIPFACLPGEARPNHRQLSGLRLPPLYECLPEGCHLSRQVQALPY